MEMYGYPVWLGIILHLSFCLETRKRHVQYRGKYNVCGNDIICQPNLDSFISLIGILASTFQPKHLECHGHTHLHYTERKRQNCLHSWQNPILRIPLSTNSCCWVSVSGSFVPGVAPTLPWEYLLMMISNSIVKFYQNMWK